MLPTFGDLALCGLGVVNSGCASLDELVTFFTKFEDLRAFDREFNEFLYRVINDFGR
jgi:hypothetical protein